MTLKEALKDWTDVDVAQYELAKVLGVISEDDNFQTDTKHLWWSDTPIGSMMFDLLGALEDEGLVECRAEPDLQYRWVRDDLEDYIDERAKENPQFPEMVEAAEERRSEEVKHEYIECYCDSEHHLLRFTWEDDPDWSEIYVNVHLNYYYGFWKRLWYGIKYIFGHKSSYGQFDCAGLDHKKVKQLRDFCNSWLEKHPWPYGEKATPEENLKWAKIIAEMQRKGLENAERKLKEAEALVEEGDG